MNARATDYGGNDRDDPLRSLLGALAEQADLLSRYLEHLYEESYVTTAGGQAYTVRTEPDGTVVLRLGDGERGRRPSSGADGIVVEYRLGGGVAGNVGGSTRGSAATNAARDARSGVRRSDLDETALELVSAARTATLATRRRGGRVRLVPICYVVSSEEPGGGRLIIHTPLDEKPKRATDPRRLGRVGDIAGSPHVTLLIERWDEDWGRLAWVRLEGRATLVEPDRAGEHAMAVEGLRAKYPQYLDQRLEDRPLIRIDVDGVATWSATR